MMRWLLMLLMLCGTALARDDGRYAASLLKPWFDTLKSSKGDLCCSSADGRVIEDADWESRGGHYRVRIPASLGDDYKPSEQMIWLDVPEDAVITEPNRAGRTMVWPLYGAIGVTIRCFMPGSMT
jgi:hypothetical protein